MKTRYISWDEALGYKKDELEYAAGVLREGAWLLSLRRPYTVWEAMV